MGNPRASSPEAPADGRLRRSERSRAAIVQALLDLVGEGSPQPTAEQVALRAGLGIRTVFRHFADMESLFVAMDARLQEQVLPLLLEAPPDAGIEQRARALVRQRASLFERIAPYLRSANLLRWRSGYLRAQHGAMLGALRESLLRWLPELRHAPADLLEALDLATSFEAWDRLRSDQRLGRRRALAAMERMVLALARDLGD